MPSFKMRLADRNVSVFCCHQTTRDFCSAYLFEFDFPDITVRVTSSDIEAERKKNRYEHERLGVVAPEFSDGLLETLALYRKIAEAMIDFDTFLFHGSAIAVDGVGYLFTAKSGTGKSTHTRLWRELFGRRAVMINDDKPLIAVRNGEAVIYGTPWNGKHGLGSNICAPLRAICILEIAKDNSIVSLEPMSQFPKILTQTYSNSSPEFMKKTLRMIDMLLHTVEVYKLGCNMNPDAARIAYDGMKGNQK